MSEEDGIQVSISNLEGTDMREIVISGMSAEEADRFLEFLKEQGWRRP